MCALGEVCSLQAEHRLQQDRADAAGAAAQLQAALEQGYGAALRIDRACPDALVGVAEVHALLGKMAATAGGLQACLTFLYCRTLAPILVPLVVVTEVHALLVQLATTAGGLGACLICLHAMTGTCKVRCGRGVHSAGQAGRACRCPHELMGICQEGATPHVWPAELLACVLQLIVSHVVRLLLARANVQDRS